MDYSYSNCEQKFHLFSALPSEIRQLIWKFSFHRRVIRVQLELSEWQLPILSPTLVREFCEFSYKNNESPSALLTCKEARDAALSFYNCLLDGAPPNQRTIYYHPARDSVQLEGLAALLDYLTFNGLRPADIEIRLSIDRS